MTSSTDKYNDLSSPNIGQDADQFADQFADPDAAFGKRLAAHFAPARLTPNQRAAFDIALAERIEKRRQRTFFVPAFATVAAAVAVLIFTLNSGIGLNPSAPSNSTRTVFLTEAPMAKAPTAEAPVESEAESADRLAQDEWAYDLLAFNTPMAYVDASQELTELDETYETENIYASDGNDEEHEENVLPGEYLAIESMFLEG